jgi:hypothetical protein
MARKTKTRAAKAEITPLQVEMKRIHVNVRGTYVLEYRRFMQRTRGIPFESNEYGKYIMVQWDGGRDKNTGKTYKPIWPNITKHAYLNHVDPLDLIRSVFASWPRVDRPPFPNMMLSEAALVGCRRYRANLVENMKAQTTAAIARIQARVAAYRHANPDGDEAEAQIEAVLREKTLPPVIGLVIANAYHNKVLIDRFLHPAALSYIGAQREWDAAVGDYFPEDVKEYARDCVMPDLRGTTG